MNCTECENAIIERLAGDGNVEQQSELNAHLASCPGCAAEAKECARLGESLASLGSGYARVQPPFVFEPSELRVERGHTRGTIQRFVRVSLTTAAVLVLVIVFWPAQITRESAPQPAARMLTPRVGTIPLPSVLETPTIRLSPGRTRLSTGRSDARVPALPRLAGPRPPERDRVRVRTPSLIIQRRRLTNVDDPQSRFDARDGLRDLRVTDA